MPSERERVDALACECMEDDDWDEPVKCLRCRDTGRQRFSTGYVGRCINPECPHSKIQNDEKGAKA